MSSSSRKMSKTNNFPKKPEKKKNNEPSSESESESETDSKDSKSTYLSSSESSSKSKTKKRTKKSRKKSKSYCQKCKAHGKEVTYRMHKKRCPYKKCQCSACKLVNDGRLIVARQIAHYRCGILEYRIELGQGGAEC